MSWQLTTFIILGLALALGFAWYERSRPPARVLALVAALAALAVVGRIAFAPFPNVKPTTDIVLFAGYALGGAPGFAVGAVTALVSNIFFSHGPWTPWQMAAWGGVGMAGGALGALVRRGSGSRQARGAGDHASSEPRELGRWGLAVACGLAGLGFGIVMDLHLWTLGAEQTLASYVVLSARSLPFNVAHIVGNVAFCLVIGPPLVRALRRYRRRFEVRWAAPAAAVSARVPAACVALTLVLAGVALVGTPAAEADSATARATRYLLGSQNCDGGFASGRGGSSAQSYTAEAGFGLAAAGWNPRDVKRGDRSLIDHVRRGSRALTTTSELSRTILLVRAAGLSPRRFAGRDLHAELLDRREENGSFDDGVAFTAFAVLALRASGDSASSLRGSARWLAERQNPDDGGFGLARGGASDSDLTGAVLQALAAADDPDEASARAIDDYLREAQRPGGGFGQTKTGAPNAHSTAYAVQGLVAAGRGNDPMVGDALTYLRGLQAADGSIRKSRTSRATPVWVTAQALAALRKQAFPLDKAGRRRPEPSNACVRTSRDGEAAKDAGREADPAVSPARKGARARRPRRPSRASSDERRATAPAAGGIGTGFSGGPTGPGGGAGFEPSASPIGSSVAPFGASPLAVPGLSGAIGAVGGLATPTPALPNPPGGAKPPARPQPPSPSANRGRPRTPVAASKPLGARNDKPGPRVGAGAGILIILLVAGGLLLATGGGARARRLWAAARRRTT